MTRSEHLEWCKKRALEYVDSGNLKDAYNSMCSDLSKHEETKNHPAAIIGMQLMLTGGLSTPEKMINFINGFN